MGFEVKCISCGFDVMLEDNAKKFFTKEVASMFICDNCEDDKLLKENQKKLDKVNAERDAKSNDIRANPSKYLAKCGVGKRHLFANLSDFDSKVSTSAYDWLSGEMHDPVMIQSKGVGNGKTHLACAILLEYISKTHNMGIFIPAVDMLLLLRGSFDSSASDKETELIEKWSKCGMLVIDDLGSEKTSEYAMQVIYQVVNRRYVNMLPTIITTNASSEDIGARNGNRVLSRISSGLIILIEGGDLRAKSRVVVK